MLPPFCSVLQQAGVSEKKGTVSGKSGSPHRVESQKKQI